MTLLALHVSGLRPAGFRSNLPAQPSSTADTERFVAAPSPRHIRDMDQALDWVRMIPQEQLVLRKIVLARMLTSPRNEKPVHSWRALGQMFGCSHVAAKSWWIRGVEMIVARLNQPGLCQRPEFRGTRQIAELAVKRTERMEAEYA